MSQKSTRRARRQTIEEEKVKTPKPTENAEDSLHPAHEASEETAQEDAKIEQNGTEKDSTETESSMVTRSRSATPQVKKMNGREDKEKEETVAETPQEKDVKEAEDKEKEETVVATPQDKNVNGSEDKEVEVAVVEEQENEDLNVSSKDTETEMDPLIISDEADPELVFEDNSDLESGRSSPILIRCRTRRSVTRNIPTPKTPKLVEDNDDVTPSPPVEADTTNKDGDQDLNATFESCCDDVSTKAQAGGDSTRLDYMNKDLSNLEVNTFLQEAKNKSFGETLRRLSTRRTIRPIHDDYRRRFLPTNVDKTDYSTTYPTRNSVERISSVGIKRKNSDGAEGLRKKPKIDSPGFLSKFTSPLTSIKNTFRSDIPSSTPKLMGYKDEKFMLEDDGINSNMYEVESGERRWCAIM